MKRPMRRTPEYRLHALALCAVLLLSGCGTQRVTRALAESPPASMPMRANGEASHLKAHLESGEVVVFSTWTSGDEAIEGTGRRLGVNREVIEEGQLRVPLDEIAIYETNELRPAGPAIALGIVTGASAALTVFCLINTKACFGSCPTFYALTEGGEALLAEGFSGSIAPALEATDVDDLHVAVLSGRHFDVRMKNEALETHVVRHADLLLVPRADGGSVWHEDGRGFVAGSVPVAPTACVAEEGDCLGALTDADGAERLSAADSADLAAREVVELTFDVPPGERHGLVLVSRQSLVTTFLFYQMLAYMGRDVGDWFAHLELRAREAAATGESLPLGLVDGLGGIEVLVEGAVGAWNVVGEAMEHGPLAVDRHLVRLPLLTEGPARVRLRLARGAWRLDAAALVSLGDPVEPLRLRPSRVLRDGAEGATEDGEALRRLLDPTETLVTLPGDAYTLVYALPEGLAEAPERYAPFLESRGYYLEWVREEWMEEEDPAAVALLLYDPEEALRQLAPHYKTLEPHMEQAFWNSRYVRR